MDNEKDLIDVIWADLKPKISKTLIICMTLYCAKEVYLGTLVFLQNKQDIEYSERAKKAIERQKEQQ